MRYPDNQLDEDESWTCEVCYETFYFDNEGYEDICNQCKMSDY